MWIRPLRIRRAAVWPLLGAPALAFGQIAPTVTFRGAPATAPFGSTFTVTATANASTVATITATGSCVLTLPP